MTTSSRQEGMIQKIVPCPYLRLLKVDKLDSTGLGDVPRGECDVVDVGWRIVVGGRCLFVYDLGCGEGFLVFGICVGGNPGHVREKVGQFPRFKFTSVGESNGESA